MKIIINNHHQLILNVGIMHAIMIVVFCMFIVDVLLPSFFLFFLIIDHLSIDLFYLEHVIETDYHAPPVGDFGYGGFRDTYESWEAAGAGGYAMNGMFADGGFATDYELSNINSVSMTPNGKYAIVGQSQGPPQIWDAVVSEP